MGNGVKAPQTPTFPDVMDNFRAQIFYDLYCHLPGTILTFDRTKGTATIQPGYKKVYPSYSAPGGKTTASYPTLTNVMVFLMQGGDVSIGADPAPGDPCLLLVADRNLDAWRQNGGQQAPLSDRAHSLADCFALVGFNPLSSRKLSARVAGEGGIADKLAKVVVKDGRVAIANQVTDILTDLTNLVTALRALCTGISAESGTIPTAAAAATTANAALAIVQGQLNTLLYTP